MFDDPVGNQVGSRRAPCRRAASAGAAALLAAFLCGSPEVRADSASSSDVRMYLWLNAPPPMPPMTTVRTSSDS